jgi:hypothetical protein
MEVSRMDNINTRIIGVENEVKIDKSSNAEFLFEYQKAVLLTLLEQGIINDIQCQQCIEKLTNQFRK